MPKPREIENDVTDAELGNYWSDEELKLFHERIRMDDEFKLKIELVPSTSWCDNVRRCTSKQGWDEIRRKAYADAGHKCEICGEKGQLHCHEKWSYVDERLVQKLEGLEAICVNCHMIKHAGFSMHTEQGRRQFDRNKLIAHFCKVNDCERTDFMKHEKEAFRIYRERSEHQWRVDLGELWSGLFIQMGIRQCQE